VSCLGIPSKETIITIDISNCESEPIRFPGAIQPHGALLVLDAKSRVVEAASESCDTLLGRPAEKMLGQHIFHVLDPNVVAQLLALQNGDVSPLVLMSLKGRELSVRSHSNANGQVLVDIEPVSEDRLSSHFLYLCRQGITSLRHHTNVESITQEAARLVQNITGFDRVMIYRFDEAWNGQVIAESCTNALEPYLGLHFPASDIPQQARELFKSSRVRLISDVNYTPSSLMARGDHQLIDLGISSLRSVSPVHIAYLKNMGVCATMVGSLVVEGALWGLVSCQHKSGIKYLGVQERDALGWLCEDIASLIEGRLIRQKQVIQAELALRRRRLVDKIREVDFQALMQLDEGKDLQGVVNADGFAVQFDDVIGVVGHAPSTGQIGDMLRRRRELAGDSALFFTHALCHDLDMEHVDGGVAGALFVCLPGKPAVTMIWFRKERAQTVTWGGDPHQPHTTDEDGRMLPRKSFEQFLTIVSGKSLPWSAEELDSAAELGSLIEIEALRERDIFTQTILNSMPPHIAVLDRHGVICKVNAYWSRFAKENEAPELVDATIGKNYMNFCAGDSVAVTPAWAGINAVLKGNRSSFTMDYPCDSPNEKRWFCMNVYPLLGLRQGAIVAHENITGRKLMEEELAAEKAEVALGVSRQRLRELVVQNEMIRNQERKYIAQEIHDELGQVLTGLRMSLLLMEMRYCSLDPTLPKLVSDMKGLLDRGIGNIRNIVSHLRPAVVDVGIRNAIECLCHECQKGTDLMIDLDIPSTEVALDDKTFVVVYRVVQESLTNIVRHAKASKVGITLDDHDGLEVEIHDNGVGFNVEEVGMNKSFGLLGMRERAIALEGCLIIDSEPTKGTSIRLALPLKPG
jgi:signal transduction histidine kinase/GAF domain-containing protein